MIWWTEKALLVQANASEESKSRSEVGMVDEVKGFEGGFVVVGIIGESDCDHDEVNLVGSKVLI